MKGKLKSKLKKFILVYSTILLVLGASIGFMIYGPWNPAINTGALAGVVLLFVAGFAIWEILD